MSGALLPGLAAELAALDGVRQRHAAPPDPARELIVDNFAGGGGASTGIAMALGRHPDIAINHDEAAICMHLANHPTTRHFCQSVWAVDPEQATGGRPVGLAWFSPDCKHFSKAKGGKPVERQIRDLAWVVVKWAKAVRPRLIMLENVEEFVTWGPLGDDGRPCKERKGQEFRKWLNALKALGYKVEWQELRACDYGAPTIRKRFFLVARCDGLPIVWPEPTHGDPKSEAVRSGRLKPWRTAAEIIDWSLPCPSIFLTREEGRAVGCNRPLAEATMARVARGVKRYVIDAARPFLVNLTHHGGDRTEDIGEPARTVTGAPPQGVVAAFIAQHNAGPNEGTGARDAGAPLSTVTQSGSQQTVVTAEAAHLLNLKGSDRRDGPAEHPAFTVTAGGYHIAEVRAFLLKYYGTGDGQEIGGPAHTVTTKDRFGLVCIEGEDFQIVDIGMRMLTPRELFRAQGFPDTYIIEPEFHGRPLTKTEQVSKAGNSVCPALAEALARANYAAPAAANDQTQIHAAE